MILDWKNIVQRLSEESGVVFERGLSRDEIERVERKFEFRFPPDLASFLHCALPVSDGFPNWRSENSRSLCKRLSIGIRGVLQDVENGQFWYPSWGARPDGVKNRLALASAALEKLPKLIPIYKHRMIPEHPSLENNPVYSISQTDIICYGINLSRYFENDFLAKPTFFMGEDCSKKRIEFWDDVKDGIGQKIEEGVFSDRK